MSGQQQVACWVGEGSCELGSLSHEAGFGLASSRNPVYLNVESRFRVGTRQGGEGDPPRRLEP